MFSDQWTRIAVQFHFVSFLLIKKKYWNHNPACFGESLLWAASRIEPRGKEILCLRALVATLHHVQGV